MQQMLRNSRGDKIRTCGLCVPNAALYQTEPRLDFCFGALATVLVHYASCQTKCQDKIYIFVISYNSDNSNYCLYVFLTAASAFFIQFHGRASFCNRVLPLLIQISCKLPHKLLHQLLFLSPKPFCRFRPHWLCLLLCLCIFLHMFIDRIK